MKLNRDKTIQIKVTEREKEIIELYVLSLKSIQDNTRYTVSSYISESIMNEVKEYKEELELLEAAYNLAKEEIKEKIQKGKV